MIARLNEIFISINSTPSGDNLLAAGPGVSRPALWVLYDAMLLSQRIEAAFKTTELDGKVFQRSACDLLSAIYPDLVPLTGGSDMGRDADLGALEGSPRLVATTEQDPAPNLRRSIAQMQAKALKPKKVVLATSQPVSATKRQQLATAAAKKGVKLIQVFDRTWFALQLLHRPDWRRELLGITAPPAALVEAPIELGRRGEYLRLAGRAEELGTISVGSGDLILVGPPGIGKTRVLAEVPRVAFVESGPDPEQLADDLDELQPQLVVVENAVRRPTDLRLLRRLREEEAHRQFRIAITVWADELNQGIDLLPAAERIEIRPLEQGEITAIARALGIRNHWLLVEIVEQARGRAGWAVALSRVALRGGSLSLFRGDALASEVVRFLRSASGSDDSLHVLAQVALFGRVPEQELRLLARRSEMRLPTLMKILHASTADGILERGLGGWAVEPAPLRAALLQQWFFAADAREPVEAMAVEDDPQLELDLLGAALVAARHGSAEGRAFAERGVQPMAAWAAKAKQGALALVRDFAGIDLAAAEWAVRECILPLLTDPQTHAAGRKMAVTIAGEAAERFLISDATKVMLGEATTFTGRDNDPGHPITVLAEAATRVLPDIKRDAQRRSTVLTPALEWLDEQPTPERWAVVARLADSLASPVVSGHWMNPDNPLALTLSGGAEPVEVMETIGRDIWPQIENRLDGAPDSAVLQLIHTAGEWVAVATGVVMLGAKVSKEQRSTARRIGQQVIDGLARRAVASPGLTVALRTIVGKRARIRADAEFELLASDHVGSKDWEAHRLRLQRLVNRWAKYETPRSLMPRLAAVHEQLKLVGRGDYTFNYALELLAGKVADVDAWAMEAVSIGVPAYPVFDAALRVERRSLPAWFNDGLESAMLRPWLLQAAFLPGASRLASGEALRRLGSRDSPVIIRGIRERERVDELVEGLLKHPEREIRSTAAITVSSDSSNMCAGLTEELKELWMAAIRDARPEHLPHYLRHDLVRTLESLTTVAPRSVATWLETVISEQKPKGFVGGLDREYRRLIPKLPPAEREFLLTRLPSKGARQAFMFEMRGSDAAWVCSAMESQTITTGEGLIALHEAPRAYFEQVAPLLLDKGVAVEELLHTLIGTFGGDESAHYDELGRYCESLGHREQSALQVIGNAGVQLFGKLKEQALRDERRERVYGI